MTDADAAANHRPGLPLAVVVGAGGMAMAIARRLGDSHRMLLADREREHLERQVVALRSEGHEVHGVTCDVLEPDAVRRLAAAAE
jgi:NAD(P)-dependent dehydrogenase (short-subunit alcohol dehydrogenase family)